MSAWFIIADVFDGLTTLEDSSVDLIVTSPPFLALRSYLPAEHELKAKEIGTESTPGAYIDRLLDVVEACARVLAPHGSIAFELGDTYAGSGGAGGDYADDGLREGQPVFDGSAARARRAPRTLPWADDLDATPLDKSKVCIPQIFAFALTWGFNPLTLRRTPRWRVRNTVAWCRPNPPVGRDGDKFRPATSHLTIACKARDRYWDGEAVRVPYIERRESRGGTQHGGRTTVDQENGGRSAVSWAGSYLEGPGAPLLDYWVIPTAPYKGAHYATFPTGLVVPLVKAMCPQRVCRACGKPSRRITETERMVGGEVAGERPLYHPTRASSGGGSYDGSNPGHYGTNVTTLGWTDCGHDDWRLGMVVDPFAGSGTTLEVASGHGLDCVGFDLDCRNAELATERVGGLFLTVETL